MVKPRLFIAERVCTEFLSFYWLLRSSITPKKKMFSVHRIFVASSKKECLWMGEMCLVVIARFMKIKLSKFVYCCVDVEEKRRKLNFFRWRNFPAVQTIARQTTLGVWGDFRGIYFIFGNRFFAAVAQHSTASERDGRKETRWKETHDRSTQLEATGSFREVEKKTQFLLCFGGGGGRKVERWGQESFPSGKKWGNFFFARNSPTMYTISLHHFWSSRFINLLSCMHRQ